MDVTMNAVHPDAYLVQSLHEFFSDRRNLETMTNMIANTDKMSLRTIDWFITNYSKKNNVFYTTKDGTMFNVYIEYKSQLKSYGKKWFDPFCRGDRIDFHDANGREFNTTVGQLNFFRWAIKNDIIDCCFEHLVDNEKDMIESAKKRKSSSSNERRKELSQAAIKKCTSICTKIVIKFS
jgi:hypothetical protein